jgi:hypothetical protein
MKASNTIGTAHQRLLGFGGPVWACVGAAGAAVRAAFRERFAAAWAFAACFFAFALAAAESDGGPWNFFGIQ